MVANVDDAIRTIFEIYFQRFLIQENNVRVIKHFIFIHAEFLFDNG